MNKIQQGFSMIEVLVAVLVIAIGLMGIASLQASAVSNTTSSTMEGSAALETYNLVARMRANRAFWKHELATSNVHDIFVKKDTDDKFVVSGESISQSTDVDCAEATAFCTPGEMARYDLLDWIASVENHLSVDNVKIGVPEGFPKHLIINIYWSKRTNAFALENSDDFASYTLKVVM